MNPLTLLATGALGAVLYGYWLAVVLAWVVS